MITIESGGDVVQLEVVDECVIIRRALAGSDGRQWTWRIDGPTSRLISDALADCCDIIEERESY